MTILFINLKMNLNLFIKTIYLNYLLKKKLKFIIYNIFLYIIHKMVKNIKGGNKGKKMGRKFLNAPVSKTIRLADPSLDAEIYGIVTKLFGFGRFQIKDEKSKERLVVIPNKFRGRGKRDNTVVLGGLVLVGIREYESSDDPKCDLLEVYNEAEKTKLKNSGNPIFNQLKSDTETNLDNQEVADNFIFSDGTHEKYEDMLNDNESKNTSSNMVSFGDEQDQDEIDIDDI